MLKRFVAGRHRLRHPASARVRPASLAAAMTALLALGGSAQAALTVGSAAWDGRRLIVTGSGDPGETVTVVNAYQASQVLGSASVSQRRTWRLAIFRPNPVPCGVAASAPGDGPVTRDVANAPATCSPKPNTAPVCAIDTPAADVVITVGGSVAYAGTVTDQDGDALTVSWGFPGGTPATSTAEDPGNVTYAAPGTYTTTLDATDARGAACAQQTRTVTVREAQCGAPDAGISINSTSQSGCPDGAVPEQPVVNNASSSYSVLAINDLGMHCGDLDTRISSILPPFQVLLAQVIRKGSSPQLNPAGVQVYYSAAANPADPILADDRFDGLMADGGTYKTNFWDFPLPRGTYDAFYPAFNPFDPAQTLTPLAGPPFSVGADTGLPVPNVEDLYIGPDGAVKSGDESLTAVLHAMPGIAGPYTANDPKLAQEHYADKPFFVDFPFGYVAADVNWYEGAGIPLAAFDDNGRENAYPLVRVQAKSGGTVVATVDTVLPISGEASCSNCHADPSDVPASRSAAPTQRLMDAGLPVALSLDDPDTSLPSRVSVEYAADINVLRLHDLKHGARYVSTACDTPGENCLATAPAPCVIGAADPNGNANCLTHQALVQEKPVVCQVCHYTPALDLAQLGPMAGPPGTLANGRNQLAHQSNSRVMHNHHGDFGDLFPSMPTWDGTAATQEQRMDVLEQTCYQCHPGANVRCLRGAMFNGGMLCNDCHGDMKQVGADFSAGVSPATPGAFALAEDFYTNPATPRVPWANEPGCGSCHTGDAASRLTGTGLLVNPVDSNGNGDGIRLRQAYRTGDPKATPIVPANKRFAEPTVPASFNGFANPGAGNPQLYRVSTGHGGVMCEGCHGATHAEWPNANPDSNDNVAARQLQGHTGVVIECQTCHGNALNGVNTTEGPHGMHPVGNDTTVSSGTAAGPRIEFVDGGHEDVSRGGCAACHGPGRDNNQGTVLSVAKKDRVLDGRLIPAGTPVGCGICHD